MEKDRTIKERTRISFTAKVEPLEKLNDEFTVCNVWICALGKNRNLSYIGKEAADDAMPTLYNLPVVGNIYEGEDGKKHMGSHDGEYIKKEDGSYEWRSKCVPYGVVPMQDDLHYEEITEEDGSVNTYLVGKMILWTGRFPELLDVMYSFDYAFNQSMEINVYDYEPLKEDKNYTNLLSYSYSALCLLGKSDDEYNVEPCFPSAHVGIEVTYAYDEKFFELMSQMKESLSECFSKTSYGKEAEQKMDNEMKDEFEIEVGESDEAVDKTETGDDAQQAETTDGAESKEFGTDENEGEKSSEESSGEGVSDGNEEGDGDELFGLSTANKRDILQDALGSWEWSDIDGNGYMYRSSYVIDYDEQFAYVGVYLSYEIDGVCKEETRYYRVRYEMSEDYEVKFMDSERVFCSYVTADELAKLEEMRSNYQALIDYKADRERKDLEMSYDQAIEEFSDLTGNEEYDNVFANRYSYKSIDELKNACYAVRGKYGLVAKPRKAPSEVCVKIGGEKKPVQTTRDRLHEEYGRK